MAGALAKPRYMCLAQDIAGGPVADETGGALGQAGRSCGWYTISFIIRFNNRKGVGLLFGVRQWLKWIL